MFNSKTVFVVGAGASYEAGLPLGNELLGSIATGMDFRIEAGLNITSGNDTIFSAWRAHTQDQVNDDLLNAILGAARTIHNAHGLSKSIDQFIDTHRDKELVAFAGKSAIPYFILEAEKNSVLAEGRAVRNDKLFLPALQIPKILERIAPWYKEFSETLFEGVSAEEVETIFDNITIVCFNYDRCIEHYLGHAISLHYQIDLSEAAGIVSERLRIFHPYGTVGELVRPNSPKGLQFGQMVGGAGLIKAANRIRTFTEQRDQGMMDAIQAEVSGAETMVFLGFGFLPDNMEILRPSVPTNVKRIIATALGELASNREEIKKSLFRLSNSERQQKWYTDANIRDLLFVTNEESWSILSTY